MQVREIYDSMSYGPAPESRVAADEWLDEHKRRFDHFIAGRWQAPVAGGYFDSINPADSKVLAKIAQGGSKDVDAAVAAAAQALDGWQKLGGHGRARYLYALARQIQK